LVNLIVAREDACDNLLNNIKYNVIGSCLPVGNRVSLFSFSGCEAEAQGREKSLPQQEASVSFTMVKIPDGMTYKVGLATMQVIHSAEQ